MAESPAHRFGQLIGELLEAVVRPQLEDFCRDQGLYLDHQKRERPARSGKKVSWMDQYGNVHDLDFVIERDGVSQHTSDRPLVIVLDNGSIHHSRATQAAFALLENQPVPLFLPRYCSQLNPIERYWKHLKHMACANKLFTNMNALVASVEQTLHLKNDCQSDSRFMFLKNFT